MTAAYTAVQYNYNRESVLCSKERQSSTVYCSTSYSLYSHRRSTVFILYQVQYILLCIAWPPGGQFVFLATHKRTATLGYLISMDTGSMIEIMLWNMKQVMFFPLLVSASSYGAWLLKFR